MYNILRDELVTESLINQFFTALIWIPKYLSALDNFASMEGYGIEYQSILFQSDFDESEEEFSLLEGQNVGLFVEPPIAKSEGVILINFLEFYNILDRKNMEFIDKYPEKSEIAFEKLEKVKNILFKNT